MTEIYQTDAAIIRLLDNCNFPDTTVSSAPHEWDAGFVTRLLGDLPAILVAFAGAEGNDSRSSALTMNGAWNVYLAVGWNGADQKARRLGAGAGYDLLHRVASVLNGAPLKDENGESLGTLDVTGIGIEADSALDLANLWVATVAVEVSLQLDIIDASCIGPLDDFIRVRGGFDVEGGKPRPDSAEAAYTDADLPVQQDLDQ